ncbi:MAG: BMP family ABC transporter substrate-binding protein [Gordonia sp. (in: high G+C Gram-positive bacteria)]
MHTPRTAGSRTLATAPTVLIGLLVAIVLAVAGCSPEADTKKASSEPKVAILLGGLANDGGFNQYGADAVHNLEKAHKITAQVRESVTTDSDAQAALRQYASQGYDLVIGWGLDFANSVFTVAKEFPNAHFLATGSADILAKTTSNVETWTYASDQQGYLLGWVAGKAGLSPYGVVDGELAPFNEASYKAFAVGFKATNPTAIALKPVFTGSWEDPSLANQATKAQIASGAKLIVTGAEGYTPGVIAAAKAAGVATIGASAKSSSDAASVNIGYVKLDFTPILAEAVEHVSAGKFGKHGYTSTIANHGLIFADYHKVAAAPGLPDDLEAQTQQLAADLAAGRVTIPPIS